MHKQIGFIGIGLMGLPMAKNILKAGYNLKVFNRTKSKAEPLKEYGAKITNTIQDLVKECDIVITMLTEDVSVDELSDDDVSEDVSAVDVDSDDAPVSLDVAVPEDVSPESDDVNTILVLDNPLSTIPSKIIDVELPFSSGAK